MWHLFFLFVFVADVPAEELSTPPTYQPFLPTQHVDVQLLPDDQEPSAKEDKESVLDPENLLIEAVRLLQIDNIQTLEEKLHLAESALKEKEEEVQIIKVELENTQKAHALAMEEAMSTHQGEIQALRSELESAQTFHAEEIVEMRLTNQNKILAMERESEKIQKAHALEIEETQSRQKKEIDTMKMELEDIKQAHALQINETRSAHSEEMKQTESLLEEKLQKSWILSTFMMKVLKKSEVLMKSREELILTQAVRLKEEANLTIECMEEGEESLRIINESQKVIQSQRETIEDLKKVVIEESSLNTTYHEIKEANLLKTNCDIPPFLTAITKALTTQQLEIEELKAAVAGENNVAELLTGINKEVTGRTRIEQAEAGNWEGLTRCQEVLQEQSSSLDLLKTLASYGVTRNNSLRYKEDEEGRLVSTGFCQCIPDLPELPESSKVSLTVTKDKDNWSPQWSVWEYDNCKKVDLHDGTSIECGEGSKSRRRLKDLNAEVWEEEVEEVACQFRNCECFVYKELNSPTRKSTHGEGSFCDKNGDSTSSDWRGKGWYRITGQAGSKLVDSPVNPSHCGTLATGWLSGGHPTVAQGEVSRTVKFEWTDKKQRKADIKVINCSTHYVYYLVEPGACFLGYCTE